MGDVRKWNEILRHERVSHNWTQAQVAQALHVETKRVSEWEGGKTKPSFKYRAKLQKLFKLSAEEFGFLDHEATIDENYPRVVNPEGAGTSQESLPASSITSIDVNGQQPIQFLIPHDIPQGVSIHIHMPALTSTSPASEEYAIIDNSITKTSGQEHPSEIEDIVNRRDFNRKALSVATAAFLAPADALNTELLDRFKRALQRPTTIDERFLSYLETRTENYWRDRQSATLASSDLLHYVSEHFEKIVQLLEGSLLPTMRTHLCSLASKTALLLGELLLDMNQHARARAFQNSAITSAREANNQALEAISWGRLSLGWIYSDQARNALDCVQEAQRLAASNTTLTNAWLAAIEAEARANVHHRDACLRALDESEHIEDQHQQPEDSYLIHFDRSLLEGYQGVCYRKLYHPEDTQSAMYLEKAQIVLLDALARLDSSTIVRQPTYLRDLADTHVKKGEIEEACERAIQAVTLAAHVQLHKVVKRLLTLRQELEPWKNTQYVQALDDHLTPLLIAHRWL
jgi:transcriptional regulator with XRE-family HTH domain